MLSISPRRGLKNAKWPSSNKTAFFLRKYVTNFLCVNTFRGSVVRHSLAYLTMNKWLVGDVLFYLKFRNKVTHAFKNGDSPSIFTRSASTITLVVWCPVFRNRKSTVDFQMSLWWTAYIVCKPPPCSVVSLQKLSVLYILALRWLTKVNCDCITKMLLHSTCRCSFSVLTLLVGSFDP